jgi:hypothetical protein
LCDDDFSKIYDELIKKQFCDFTILKFLEIVKKLVPSVYEDIWKTIALYVCMPCFLIEDGKKWIVKTFNNNIISFSFHSQYDYCESQEYCTRWNIDSMAHNINSHYIKIDYKYKIPNFFLEFLILDYSISCIRDCFILDKSDEFIEFYDLNKDKIDLVCNFIKSNLVKLLKQEARLSNKNKIKNKFIIEKYTNNNKSTFINPYAYGKI